MRYTLLFVFLCLARTFCFSQITFIKPSSKGSDIIDKILQIQVKVPSTIAIASITGSVKDSSKPLTLDAPHTYSGSIHLSQFAYGTYYVVCTVVDSSNATYKDSVRFFNGYPPPVLTVYQPLPYTIIRTANYPLKVAVSTPDTVQFVIRGHTNYMKDSATFIVPFAKFNGQVEQYQVKAKDRFGQATERLIPLFTDTSSNLQQVYQGPPTLISAYSNNKILYYDTVSYVLTHLDLTTNTKTIVPNGGRFGLDMVITDFGAVFGTDQELFFDSLFAWAPGSYLNNLGAYYPGSLREKGDYAAWMRQNPSGGKQTFLFGNVKTIDTAVVDIGQFNIDYNVSAAGYLAYSKCSHDTCRLYLVNDTTKATTLVPTGGIDPHNPVFDGKKLFFVQNKNICLYNNGLVTVIAKYVTPEIYTSAYLVNNNFVAYIKKDDNGYKQVWLRHGSVNTQITFGANTYMALESLNAEGGIVFVHQLNGAKPATRVIYYDDTHLRSHDITTTSGGFGAYYFNNHYFGQAPATASFYNGDWYTVLGSALFKLNVSSPLPVTLLSFTAEKSGKNNLLNWITTNELNMDRIEVQRGNNSGDIVTIATLPAYGLDKTTNNYSYTDKAPLKYINYYRLKLIDKDGKFTYSPVRVLNNSLSFDVSLYPNPSQATMVLHFNSEKATAATVLVTDMLGKIIYSKSIQLPAGASTQNIPATMLTTGSYLIKCVTADGTQTILKAIKE